MQRNGWRSSSIMMLIWERDSQSLAIIKFTRRGTFLSGGINLTLNSRQTGRLLRRPRIW